MSEELQSDAYRTRPGPTDPSSKIVGGASLSSALALLPRPLVFTNGVFDILHVGHVSYLGRARAAGAALIIGLNSNKSVRMLGKGPDRPLNNELDRALVLAALEAVSLVTLFDEQTPVALLNRIRPDVYVKGGDYDIETLEEARLVRSWGGKAFALPFIDGYSTTGLVARMRSSGAH